MYRVILHLDMDAFYASVEQRDKSWLRGKPVIVGSPDQRGVVCAASYEARRFGVRSAMPSVTAKKLCPAGVFIHPRMNVYRRESQAIMAIVNRMGVSFEQVSIDEAYIDATSLCQDSNADTSLNCGVPLARKLKEQITEARTLTTSIGIASNKLLAKIASDFSKPDGLTLVPESQKVHFLRPLPVRVIHGVGTVAERTLSSVGLRTVGDLQDYSGDLRLLLGSFGHTLKRFAFGEDDRTLELGEDIKSVSSENTFPQDADNREILRKCLWTQAEEIAHKLEKRGLRAHTVQVKVRYSDFTTLTRQISVNDSVGTAREIYRLGCHLLKHNRLVARPLRLLGLGVARLNCSGFQQLTLKFDLEKDKKNRVSKSGDDHETRGVFRISTKEA